MMIFLNQIISSFKAHHIFYVIDIYLEIIDQYQNQIDMCLLTHDDRK